MLAFSIIMESSFCLIHSEVQEHDVNILMLCSTLCHLVFHERSGITQMTWWVSCWERLTIYLMLFGLLSIFNCLCFHLWVGLLSTFNGLCVNFWSWPYRWCIRCHPGMRMWLLHPNLSPQEGGRTEYDSLVFLDLYSCPFVLSSPFIEMSFKSTHSIFLFLWILV